MLKTSNKNARNIVENRCEFNGSNTFGRFESDCYAVYSYGYHFPMFVFKYGQWHENSEKYSVSTSKQQTQLRPFISGNFTMKSTYELKELIRA